MPEPLNLLGLLLAALGLLALALLRFRRQQKAAAVTPLPAETGLALPDLARFRPVEMYFTRDHLRQLLTEMARFQQEAPYHLPPPQVQRHLQRVVKRLQLAGELARQEKLPEGDLVTLYLAVVYSAFVTPEMNPVYHTWYGAALARSRLLEQGLTRHAALKVSRAIREYPLRNPVLGRRLAYGLAQLVAASRFEPARYDKQLRQVIVEVLEKSEADFRQVRDFIQQIGPAETGNLAQALHTRFQDTALAWPTPSTPELWEKIRDVDVLEPDEIHSYRQVRVYSVGTPAATTWTLQWSMCRG